MSHWSKSSGCAAKCCPCWAAQNKPFLAVDSSLLRNFQFVHWSLLVYHPIRMVCRNKPLLLISAYHAVMCMRCRALIEEGGRKGFITWFEDQYEQNFLAREELSDEAKRVGLAYRNSSGLEHPPGDSNREGSAGNPSSPVIGTIDPSRPRVHFKLLAKLQQLQSAGNRRCPRGTTGMGRSRPRRTRVVSLLNQERGRRGQTKSWIRERT